MQQKYNVQENKRVMYFLYLWWLSDIFQNFAYIAHLECWEDIHFVQFCEQNTVDVYIHIFCNKYIWRNKKPQTMTNGEWEKGVRDKLFENI